MSRLLAVVALLGVVLGAYLLWARPRQLRWGATEEEIARSMPGDALVPGATFDATRAVTIEGTPEEIWPWLLQIGYGRAGFYGYDLIENLGSERGLRSAESIVPELQQLAVGDDMPITATTILTIRELEPNRFMVWSDASDPPNSAFSWGLYPIDESRTRLINRFRFRHRWGNPAIVLELFTDFADPVAVRKVLLGVKDRVEGRVESLARQNAEIALWLLAFLEFVVAAVAIFVRQRWWRGWWLGLAAGTTLLIVLYTYPPLWLGALLEVGVLVGLLWAYRSASQIGWRGHRKGREARPSES